ncbi:9353_t:CDS:2, partial [Racocetra persica]
TNISTTGQISIASTVQCTKEIVAFLTGYSPQSWLSAKPMLTILNMKDIDQCSVLTVSSSVGEAIIKNSLNPAQCQYWLTDNMAYMSGSTAGADTNFTNLPNGFRASEMPDNLEQWIHELQTAIKHPDEDFVEELLLAYEILPKDEFIDFNNRIENGLIKALEAFKKWMDPWTHLPLSICRLGEIHGPDFAVAVIKVILNIQFSNNLTEIQKEYVDKLEDDLETKKQESFGLFQALEDNDFHEQFLAFSQSTYTEISNYPL